MSARIAAFEEMTKHMTDENPLEEFPLLAAKYKNRWIAERFLANVLGELFFRFSEIVAKKTVRTKAAKKRMQDPMYAEMFEKYVRQKMDGYKKEFMAKKG